MQRHGGQTRPAGEPAAKAATKAGATPPRENADEDNRKDADAGSAPEKSNKAKN
jgi:hypothetical protein